MSIRAHLLAISALAVVSTSGCVVPNPSYEDDGGMHLTPQLSSDGLLQDDSGAAPDSSPPPPAPDSQPPPVPDLSPPSGKLCAPCDPNQSNCSEPGGLCLIANKTESFCTKACNKQTPCPSGYKCMEVKVLTGSASPWQCVPVGLSCVN